MTATLNYVVTTGDHIVEWMEDEGINAAELARRLGVTPKHVSELLNGKAPLSHQLALALERVTGIPARIWNLYEANYRGRLASRAADDDLAEQYEKAKEFPLGYLRKHGFITAPARDRVGTVRQLLSILGVANIEAFWATWAQGSVAYRRRAVARENTTALATWLALAERHHDGVRGVAAFDRAGLERLVPELRALTIGDPTAAISEAIERLRAAGVVLCLIPPVPGLGIHGATRWLNETPVIQLSLLWKSDDQLWFTLFHELGHVLLHGNKELYLNGESNTVETEANDYASELLIPSDTEHLVPKTRDIGAIRALAEELGIAPSIVLGRAQRETRDYAWGHELKRKFEWVAEAGD
ncbi:MAG: ImmA/IrrE family metallo-endopeptidase [Actinomycetia bacterium]|nr:ImmA/IrrE family metallo-endopeptidase [Actinomycetes bacterium]